MLGEFLIKNQEKEISSSIFFFIQNSPFRLINYDTSKRLIINQPLSIVERMEKFISSHQSSMASGSAGQRESLLRSTLSWHGPRHKPRNLFSSFFSLNLTGLQTAKGLHPSKFLGQVSPVHPRGTILDVYLPTAILGCMYPLSTVDFWAHLWQTFWQKEKVIPMNCRTK